MRRSVLWSIAAIFAATTLTAKASTGVEGTWLGTMKIPSGPDQRNV